MSATVAADVDADADSRGAPVHCVHVCAGEIVFVSPSFSATDRGGVLAMGQGRGGEGEQACALNTLPQSRPLPSSPVRASTRSHLRSEAIVRAGRWESGEGGWGLEGGEDHPANAASNQRTRVRAHARTHARTDRLLYPSCACTSVVDSRFGAIFRRSMVCSPPVDDVSTFELSTRHAVAARRRVSSARRRDWMLGPA